MYVDAHGGSCCGISHICDVGYNLSVGDGVERVLRLMNDYIENEFDFDDEGNNSIDKWGHLFEITLTDQQVTDVVIRNLKALKFRHVNRFYNQNSGNYVNIFHLATHQPRGRNRRPQPFKY